MYMSTRKPGDPFRWWRLPAAFLGFDSRVFVVSFAGLSFALNLTQCDSNPLDLDLKPPLISFLPCVKEKTITLSLLVLEPQHYNNALASGFGLYYP